MFRVLVGVCTYLPSEPKKHGICYQHTMECLSLHDSIDERENLFVHVYDAFIYELVTQGNEEANCF